ncbi:MAG: sulfotransferase, partial [Proteobacteria bacterium]|nr:sulfotransferase [Pseudomonadota bacterium]
LGRFPEAIAQNRILAAEPLQRWAALTRIALLDPAALDESEVAGMRDAAANPDTPPDQRVGLWFALGEVFDRQGRDAEAFAAFDAGNRAQRARVDVAGAAQANAAAVDHVRSVATSQRLARLKGQGSSSAAPIFIVGFPRSGSTLVEQILASHPQVQGLGETGVMPRLLQNGYPTTAAAARDLVTRYLEAMRARGWDGRSRFVDKTLESYLHAGVIGALFPNATVLHVQRDPIDNGFAVWRQFFVHGNETLFDLADIGAEYARYRAIMDHWDAVAPGRFLDVGYEALVADPQVAIRRLAEVTGLGWDPAMLDFHRREGAVSTASVAQVRRPIHAGPVRRWRRHAERLQSLIAALGPYAKP